MRSHLKGWLRISKWLLCRMKNRVGCWPWREWLSSLMLRAAFLHRKEGSSSFIIGFIRRHAQAWALSRPFIFGRRCGTKGVSTFLSSPWLFLQKGVSLSDITSSLESKVHTPTSDCNPQCLLMTPVLSNLAPIYTDVFSHVSTSFSPIGHCFFPR